MTTSKAPKGSIKKLTPILLLTIILTISLPLLLTYKQNIKQKENEQQINQSKASTNNYQTKTSPQKIKIIYINTNKENQTQNKKNTLLGYANTKTKTIHINLPNIKKRSKTKKQYEQLLQNVLIHELTHIIDSQLKNKDKIYNLKYITPERINYQTIGEYINLYTNHSHDIPSHLKSSINFNSVFFKRNYTRYNYKDEIIARINALCFTRNETNLSQILLSNYSICKEFNFPKHYKRTYTLSLKQLEEQKP